MTTTKVMSTKYNIVTHICIYAITILTPLLLHKCKDSPISKSEGVNQKKENKSKKHLHFKNLFERKKSRTEGNKHDCNKAKYDIATCSPSRWNKSIKKAIIKNIKKLSQCKKHVKKTYFISISYSITNDGHIKKIHIKKISNTNLHRCISRTVKNWQFPIAEQRPTLHFRQSFKFGGD